MNTTQSMDDAEAECRKLMGDPLGVVFSRLHVKLIELHIVWQQYRQLFGEGEETVNLLNRTAGLFFKIVQDDLWDSVLLGLSRMTDSKKSSGRKNLTIQELTDLIEEPALKLQVKLLCDKAVEETKFARDHRNKRIAHHDYSHSLNRSAQPLNGISREQVEHMLKALREVLNCLNDRYKGSDVRYENFIDLSGARVLVHKLERLERKEASAAPGRSPIQ